MSDSELTVTRTSQVVISSKYRDDLLRLGAKRNGSAHMATYINELATVLVDANPLVTEYWLVEDKNGEVQWTPYGDVEEDDVVLFMCTEWRVEEVTYRVVMNDQFDRERFLALALRRGQL